MPPSAMIYNDTLEPCAQNGIVAWAGLPKRDIPLLFIGHEGHEDCVDEVGGRVIARESRFTD